MRRFQLLLITLTLSGCATGEAAIHPDLITLRNVGIAALENEAPAQAEETFRKLIAVAPDEPLGHANLAISLLRQQKQEEAFTAIDKALEIAPGRADLLAIRAEIQQWSGDLELALETYSRAAAAAPEVPHLQYSLYRQATSTRGEAADAAAGVALERLAKLRPDNLVIMLQQARRATTSGDRSAASQAILRVRELAWQAPPAAKMLIGQIVEVLEAGEATGARAPTMRLENVLKVTPMYQQGLRELTMGIQGNPLVEFEAEPPVIEFGEPVEISFRIEAIHEQPIAGRALVVADFNEDEKPDVAWIVGETGRQVCLDLSGDEDPLCADNPSRADTGLQAVDLDNDGLLDLLGFGEKGIELWQLSDGVLENSTDTFALQDATGTASAILDFDIEGDLDLAIFGGKARAAELYRNSLEGPLTAIGEHAFPEFDPGSVYDALASDLDRDGDFDLLVAHEGGLTLLDNLRQGVFDDLSGVRKLQEIGPLRSIASADLDNDGWPEIIGGGATLQILANKKTHFEPRSIDGTTLAEARGIRAILPLDVDNDGRLDIALATESGPVLLVQQPNGSFRKQDLPVGLPKTHAIAAADFDRDGDLDLLLGGGNGLTRLINDGGNRNHWLSVRLHGLDTGSSKNNTFGYGSTLEIRSGSAYQFRETTGDVTHIGLGRLSVPDLLRVVWSNGVPQNRLQPAADQWIVEEQLLKGSCPFLYAWNGDQIEFVSDLLWGAPAGLPVAPGVWASADPEELVRVDGAMPLDGRYELRITEELWEAAFFDLARLWVVDHPKDVEVASSLKIVPGVQIEERVLASRSLRPVAAAWDATGKEITDRVARRDEVYADGWERSRYQGFAPEPWTFTFDLGEAPAEAIRLHLDGWIFPADASLNLAVAQRGDLPFVPPRLEVEIDGTWTSLMESTGYPAGKTKTMIIDTPPLPPGASRLRLVSNLWLSWDRIAWTAETADAEPVVQAKLRAEQADLRHRGFSSPVRRAPNGPHAFDYADVSSTSPWLPFPGNYTRYGDVRELLAEADDRSVILAPGDEIRITFDTSDLPSLPEGWTRTIFLESHGWDKDADRNTYAASRVEPLPFRAMSGYPYGADEHFPDTPLHREYLETWLTREVIASPGSVTAAPKR